MRIGLKYISLINEDEKYIQRINKLIKSIHRDGHHKSVGKPEPLKNIKWPHSTEIWSRRITKADRLVYIVPSSPKVTEFMISSCKYHYHR